MRIRFAIIIAAAFVGVERAACVMASRYSSDGGLR
jgi:hypothetical protein